MKRGNRWYFKKRINGQRFVISTGLTERAWAEQRAIDIERDIRSRFFGQVKMVPRFSEWWAIYHATYTPMKSSSKRDAQMVAAFRRHFDARRIDEITKSDVVRYLTMRATHLTACPGHKSRRMIAPSTVRRERGLLQAIFERAIEDGYDIRNPFRGIKLPADAPRTRLLSLNEEGKLLPALHPRFQRFVRFALGTGARLEEIRSIDPRVDVNLNESTFHVRGKFNRERDVPMQPDAQAALEEQIEAEGRLWTQNPQRLREVLAEGARRAGIPRLTPHALRRTFATRWLQAGGSIYILSRILGHSSVAVTEVYYVQLRAEDVIAASRRVRIAIAPRTGPGWVPDWRGR
jgi:integrase